MRTLIADHPLVTHKLTLLRDARTDTATFRTLTDELVTLLAYEATREIRVAPVDVTTPVAVATGARLTAPMPLMSARKRSPAATGNVYLVPPAAGSNNFGGLETVITSPAAAKYNQNTNGNPVASCLGCTGSMVSGAG